VRRSLLAGSRSIVSHLRISRRNREDSSPSSFWLHFYSLPFSIRFESFGELDGSSSTSNGEFSFFKSCTTISSALPNAFRYAVGGIVIAILASLPGFVFRLHHYFAAYVRLSRLADAFCTDVLSSHLVGSV